MKLNPLERKHIVFAGAIGLLALVVRLILIVVYPVHPLGGGDPTAFWSFAQGIASGQGFRSTFEPWLADRPPLYSYFLAGVFWVFGENRAVVFGIQALVGAIAASLFFLCAVRLFGTERGGIAGLAFALFPHFLLFTQQTLTEALYIPLLVILLAGLLLPEWETRLLVSSLTVGILLGLIALVRREALLPAGIIVGLVMCQRLNNWRSLVLAILVVGITTLAVLAPWLVRNQQVLGSPVLSSSGGWNFMVGNNPTATGAYTPPPAEWNVQFTGLGELERDRKAWELSLEWIRSHPDSFLALLPLKFYALVAPAQNWGVDIADLALLPFWVLGLVRVFRRDSNWLIIASIALPLVLSVVFVALVFVGGWRYRIAVYPGLILLAAYGFPSGWIGQISVVFTRLRKVFARR